MELDQNIAQYIIKARKAGIGYKQIYRELIQAEWNKDMVKLCIGNSKEQETGKTVRNVATASPGKGAGEPKAEARARKILRRAYRNYVVRAGRLPDPWYMACIGDYIISEQVAKIAVEVANALGYEIKFHKLIKSTYQRRRLPKVWINGRSCRIIPKDNYGDLGF